MTSLIPLLIIAGLEPIQSRSLSELKLLEYNEQKQIGRVVNESFSGVTVSYLEKYWTPIAGQGNYFKPGRQLFPLQMQLLNLLPSDGIQYTPLGFQVTDSKSATGIGSKIGKYAGIPNIKNPESAFLEVKLIFTFSPVGFDEKFLKNLVFVPDAVDPKQLGPLEIPVREQVSGMWRMKLGAEDSGLQVEIRKGSKSVEAWCSEISSILKRPVLCDVRVKNEVIDLTHPNVKTVKQALFVIAACNDMTWDNVGGSYCLKGSNGAVRKYEFEKAMRRDLFLVNQYVGWLVKYKVVSPAMGRIMSSACSAGEITNIIRNLDRKQLRPNEQKFFAELSEALPKMTRLCPKLQMSSLGIQLGSDSADYFHIDGVNTRYSLDY